MMLISEATLGHLILRLALLTIVAALFVPLFIPGYLRLRALRRKKPHSGIALVRIKQPLREWLAERTGSWPRMLIGLCIAVDTSGLEFWSGSVRVRRIAVIPRGEIVGLRHTTVRNGPRRLQSVTFMLAEGDEVTTPLAASRFGGAFPMSATDAAQLASYFAELLAIPRAASPTA